MKINKTVLVVTSLGLLAGSTLVARAAISSTRELKSHDGGMWVGSRPVEFETISQGIVGPWTRPALILIRNEADWTRAMIKAGAVIPVPPPEVDWNTRALVLAVLGEQPVLGYRIEVSEALRHAQDLLLKVHVELPNTPNATQNFSYPYHLVAVETWKSMGLQVEYDAVIPDIDTYQPPPQHGKEKLDRSTENGSSSSRASTWGGIKARRQ